MKKRVTEEQIVAILKESEAGVAVKEIRSKRNISGATFYTWRRDYNEQRPNSSLNHLTPTEFAVR